MDGTRAAFSQNKLDHKTWCKRCHRSHLVQDWTCPCHIPWHMCLQHCNEPSRLRYNQQERSKRKHYSAPKRPLEEACTEEGARRLDQAPVQPSQQAAEDEIDLGPNKATRLLPKLRAKFRRLLDAPEETIGQGARAAQNEGWGNPTSQGKNEGKLQLGGGPTRDAAQTQRTSPQRTQCTRLTPS